MKFDTLEILACPDCKSNLKINEIINKVGTKIINGIVECECCKYPVIDEILFFEKPNPAKHILNTQYLIELLRTNRADAAIALPLEEDKIDGILLKMFYFLEISIRLKRSVQPILSLVRLIKKRKFQKYFGKNESLYKFINHYKSDETVNLLTHRFSTDRFWSIYPFIPLLRQKKETVLNLGCEAGHLAYVIENKVNPKKLICIDDNYTMIQIAKSYFTFDTDFIYSDMNKPLPFRNKSLSSIVMMDSQNRILYCDKLARNLESIISDDGVLLLSIPNSFGDKKEGDCHKSMPVIQKDLFKKLNTHIFPEAEIIETFMKKFELDLSKISVIKKSENEMAMSILCTNENSLLRKYENLNLVLENNIRNPIINPIYSTGRRGGNSITLIRNPPGDLFFKKYPLSMKYLPENLSVSLELLNEIDDYKSEKQFKISRNKTLISDLINKFVIIDVPDKYI
ncbi:MAG: hypothetical protein ACW990_08105 [Promethearchaeota archaeon]|jgi:uncharacterized protein YbaR (Trm112 family)